MSLRNVLPKLLNAAGLCGLLSTSAAFADFAILIDTGVMVESNPTIVEPPDDFEPPAVVEPITGDSKNASYVSTGGWAVTGADFIDATAIVFDFGSTTSVANATLRLPIETAFAQNGVVPIEVYFYADNGVVEYTDYSIGFTVPITEIDAAALTHIELDVAGAVNATLNASQYVGFRVTSSVAPGEVLQDSFPPWAGVKFSEDMQLEFSPGTPPEVPKDSVNFDGYTLEVPNVEVPGLGTAYVQLRLVDPNTLLYQLTDSELTDEGGVLPPLSGIDLFDCAAFEPPDSSGVGEGVSTYSINAGVLDIPSVNFNEEQIAIRLEYIEGSDPWIFETLSLGGVQSGPSDAVISALAGGLIVEPTQDFVPLCHGWVLIGDSIRNRVVERNILSGETGATYAFNTAPDQFTLDSDAGVVYMTVHPESERLYALDINTGTVKWNRVTQTLPGLPGFPPHTYSWALRDLALGEDGNIFAMMYDSIRDDPEGGVPFTDTGLWMGLMDGDANFVDGSIIPLQDPIRIEYDSVRDHVFLATESNLATFIFDPADSSIDFVEGTDQAVGSGCTDFSISPDGNRLAYSCPNGNRSGTPDFGILDMNPLAYFDIDGEWFLGSSPVSATFNAEGTLLFATDNERMYVFDVVTHLILEDFELGLLEEEKIRKIRLSRDGQIILVYLDNTIHVDSSKFYWMPVPDINGTPLP